MKTCIGMIATWVKSFFPVFSFSISCIISISYILNDSMAGTEETVYSLKVFAYQKNCFVWQYQQWSNLLRMIFRRCVGTSCLSSFRLKIPYLVDHRAPYQITICQNIRPLTPRPFQQGEEWGDFLIDQPDCQCHYISYIVIFPPPKNVIGYWFEHVFV